MKHTFHALALFILFIVILGGTSCKKGDSATSPTSEANCTFSKHLVQETQSGTIGQPVKYTIMHYTTVKNIGKADANDVKIVVYLNGSSVSSVNVIGTLRPGAVASKDFQTVTIGARPELRISWQ